MAIIYTYPTKATLALSDLVLISDSEDANKTKQATMTSIKDVIDVVDTLTAVLPLSASSSTPGTGAVTLSIPAATSSVNGYLTSTDWSTFNSKQVELQSGVNIKTINSNSILGSGDLVISGAAANPAGDAGQIQYNNDGTSFGAGTFFTTNKSSKVDIAYELGLKGDGTNHGLLKLYCEAGTAHHVGIKGPNHTGGTPASYTIQLPNSLPNAANQILESNASGTLSWIPTPSGGGGISSITGTSPVSITSGSTPVVSMAAASTTVSGYLTTTDWNTFNNKADGISFSGATASGILTRGGTNVADVSSNIIATASQIVFDGASGNTGVAYDSASAKLNVGGIAGGSDTVSIYSAGVEAVTIASTNIHFKNSSTTLFDNGIKFGAAGSTLSKYEEGTWTPTAYVAVGTAPTVSSSNGTYTIVGDICHITFKIVVTGSSSANVSMLVGGVPAAANADSTAGEKSAGQLFVNSDSNTPTHYPSIFSIQGNLLTMIVQGGSKNSYQVDASTYATPYGLKAADATASWYRPSGGTGITLEGSATYKLA